MFEPNEVLKTLTGRGLSRRKAADPRAFVIAWSSSGGKAGVVAYGNLYGSHVGLRPIWLEPDAQLRLANGRRLNISITDLVNDTAEFEGIGRRGPLIRRSHRRCRQPGFVRLYVSQTSQQPLRWTGRFGKFRPANTPSLRKIRHRVVCGDWAQPYRACSGADARGPEGSLRRGRICPSTAQLPRVSEMNQVATA